MAAACERYQMNDDGGSSSFALLAATLAQVEHGQRVGG